MGPNDLNPRQGITTVVYLCFSYPFRGGDSYPFEALYSASEGSSVVSWMSLSDQQN